MDNSRIITSTTSNHGHVMSLACCGHLFLLGYCLQQTALSPAIFTQTFDEFLLLLIYFFVTADLNNFLSLSKMRYYILLTLYQDAFSPI